MHRFRTPELFLGRFLTIAVFAIGMLFESRHTLSNPNPTQKSDSGNEAHIEPSSFGDWITHDASGFFTAWLVVVGFGQAGLFVWQLFYMRRGMNDAAAESRTKPSLPRCPASLVTEKACLWPVPSSCGL